MWMEMVIGVTMSAGLYGRAARNAERLLIAIVACCERYSSMERTLDFGSDFGSA